METALTIALITSLASIIVAIISMISNKLNSRNLIAVNQALESLKYDIERKRIKFQLIDENLKDQFTELGNHINRIQILKDYLMFIEDSTKESLDTDTALTEIKKRVADIMDCFENSSESLESDGLVAAHSAKNLAYQIQSKLISFFKEKEYIQLNDSEKKYIVDSKKKLSEYQNKLRDSRLNILTDISK